MTQTLDIAQDRIQFMVGELNKEIMRWESLPGDGPALAAACAMIAYGNLRQNMSHRQVMQSMFLLLEHAKGTVEFMSPEPLPPGEKAN